MKQFEDVSRINPGDWRDIDDYVRELEQAGLNADYENVVDRTSGFTAVVYIEDEKHAVWEGNMHGQFVKEVKKSIEAITEGAN